MAQQDVKATRFVPKASKRRRGSRGRESIPGRRQKNETPELRSVSAVCCLTDGTAAGVPTSVQHAADISAGTEANAANAPRYEGTFTGNPKQRGGSAADPEEA